VFNPPPPERTLSPPFFFFSPSGSGSKPFSSPSEHSVGGFFFPSPYRPSFFLRTYSILFFSFFFLPIVQRNRGRHFRDVYGPLPLPSFPFKARHTPTFFFFSAPLFPSFSPEQTPVWFFFPPPSRKRSCPLFSPLWAMVARDFLLPFGFTEFLPETPPSFAASQGAPFPPSPKGPDAPLPPCGPVRT